MQPHAMLKAIEALPQAAGLPPLSTPALIGVGVGIVVLLLVLLAVWRVARIGRRLWRESEKGRAQSVVPEGTRPLTSFTRDGTLADPLNVKVIGSAGQLGAAFASAGWHRADEITLVTSIRIAVDAVFGRKYSTAPVSNLYLYGRRQDYAYEREGSSVRVRDHVRFWDSGHRSGDGRVVWVGGATKDIAVELSKRTLLPTHKIAADTDAERSVVLNDLIEAGWVVADTYEQGFGQPTTEKNGGGDPWHTDGQIAVITLADVPVFSIASTHIRGRASARVARWVTAPARHMLLPRAARERARLARQQKQTERVPVEAGKREQ